MPAENLAHPRHRPARDVGRPPAPTLAALATSCARYGARDWQIELTAPMLVDAVGRRAQPEG